MKVPKELKESTGIGFTCPICNKALPLIDSTPAVKNYAFWAESCRHRMHHSCMNKWRQKNSNCPVCGCKSELLPLPPKIDWCDTITTALFWSVWPVFICIVAHAAWKSYIRKPGEPDLLCKWTCTQPNYITTGSIDTFRYCMSKCKHEDAVIRRADDWAEKFGRSISGPPMHTAFHQPTCPLYHQPGCYPDCFATCGLHTSMYRCRYYCERICCETFDFKLDVVGSHWTGAFYSKAMQREDLIRWHFDADKEAQCENTCEHEEDMTPCYYGALCPRQCYTNP